MIKKVVITSGAVDLALSLQWLGWLLWHRFESWPRELPHAVGAAKKAKQTKKSTEPRISKL